MGKIYALIENGRVREIIKSEGIFENVPIEERYDENTVASCIECSEEIKEGMDYNLETGEFSDHIEEDLESGEQEETIIDETEE